jgi:U2-associated protein SR140
MGDKIKNIPEQKLKAFSIGTMGKRSLSKKELEEQRKKEEERAAAHVFEEFVATFQESPISSSSKVWVKAGTYDAGARSMIALLKKKKKYTLICRGRYER